MITYDQKSNVGFDFDFDIEVNDYDEEYNPEEIRDILKNAFNCVVHRYGYNYPEDSTRVLTIKKKDYWRSRIIYSCDLAIVNNDRGNQGKGYKKLPEKIAWLKKCKLWNEVRKIYLEKKNNNEDSNIHSRTIFAETIHEVCQRNRYYP